MKRLLPGLCLWMMQAGAAGPELHMTVLQPPPAPQTVTLANADTPPLHMTVLTEAPPGPVTASRDFRFHYDVGLGYRRDRLDWNIGVPEGPDVLTEEKWRDLDSIQLSGSAHLVTPQRIAFQARTAYAWVVDGDYRRTDYLENGRSDPFSGTAARADHGHFLDLSVGVGYRIQPDAWKVRPWLEPLAGYAYRNQTLQANDFRQTLATALLTPPQGPLPGTEYRYHARWHGPWVGLNLGVEGERWRLFGQGEYHFAWYRADGRFKSLQGSDRKVTFDQDADGRGVVAQVGGSYRLWRALSLQLSAEFQHWRADHGKDKTRIGGGDAVTARLNEARWRMLGGRLSLSFDF
ncbi:hypothetical protein MIT9_P2344 [Methylomarinovum caldicuralii]|uniref:Protochlamydia outer membrane protein domain-containing protein n=1 Tax=Methylomarinovum caldicuralii TaxID=438856 RepID=A0AAU9BUV5_9GAMM|nr:hypothetical protein [Methylomarinovum caldicuralii]BCX82758.1 hypothetical protein MIT9_P2344 [Methylomarinovum caldicuralii]